MAATLHNDIGRLAYLRTVALAYWEWQDNNVRKAVELLDSCDSALRNWEWHFVRNLCRGEQVFDLGEAVFIVLFTPDSKHLIAAGPTLAKIWASTGDLVRTIHFGEVQRGGRAPQVHITADACQLLRSDGAGNISVFDLETGRCIRTLRYFEFPIGQGRTRLALSPDGRTLVTIHPRSEALLWDVVNGQSRRLLDSGEERVCSACWSPDGQRLATSVEGPAGKSVIVWGNDCTFRTWSSSTATIGQCSFSPCGKYLAAPLNDDSVAVWDARTGEQQKDIPPCEQWIKAIAFSPDAAILAVAHDASVTLWRRANGALIRSLHANSVCVQTIAFSPDGTHLAGTTHNEGMVYVWKVETGAEVRLRGHAQLRIDEIAFSPSGQSLASGSEDGTVRVWDVEGDPDRTTLLWNVTVTSVAITPDGRRVLLVGREGQVAVFEFESGEFHDFLIDPKKRSVFMSLGPDGRQFATTVFEETGISLWDAQSGALQLTVGKEATAWLLAFSPDGRVLAAASANLQIRLWDTTTGESRGTLTGAKHDVLALAFSPDGRRLAAGMRDSSVLLWDMATQQPVVKFHADDEEVHSIAFSPDGKSLATGQGQKRSREYLDTPLPPESVRFPWVRGESAFRLWDLDSNRLRSRIEGHMGYVSTVEFSPDGQRLLTASYDETIKLWDLQSLQEAICLRGHRVVFGEVQACFGPNGHTILSWSTDDGSSTVRLWDGRPNANS